ncbi:MAG: hypothetical protein ACREBG_12440 [Pyrinomonadaceae bacterium]
MAEERTLALARAPEVREEELSKEELQLRMEEARDSISQTVTEIKETVAHQYETVKDALDWREHFKKRPVTWSLGAAGVGFCVGYCIASAIKGEDRETGEYVSSESHAFAGMPILAPADTVSPSGVLERSNGKDDGPGLIGRLKETRAFDRLQQEVGSLGDRLIEELSRTAQVVIVPALIRKVRDLIGADLSDKSRPQTTSQPGANMRSNPGSYQPVLERNPS